MNRTQPLLYDYTPTGHSMTLAWLVIWTFGIAGLFLFGLAFEAAIHFIFG